MSFTQTPTTIVSTPATTQEAMAAVVRNQHLDYDAIIIGAGIAGSVCALALANKGWRIAVLEKRQSLLAYKKICTHIIHPYAVNQLKKIGVFDELMTKSAQMTGMNIHHNGRSILYPFAGKLSAANIERKDLDPALKAALTKHKNITLLSGCRVTSLVKSGNHVTGLHYLSTREASKKEAPTKDSSTKDESIQLTARLVIGSDGRNSEVIKLSNGNVKKTDNQRVALFSYFSTKTTISESHVWALRQGQEYIGLFPNKQRVLISWYLPRDEFENKTETHEQSFDRLLAHINAQGIQVGERLESIIVVKDSAPQTATTSAKSLALIGDSKLAADPLTGIGCTWAMQSANLLATCLGPAPPYKSKSRTNIQTRLLAYTFIHSITFKLSSALMTLVSMHGKWVFNAPVFRCLAWFTRKKRQRKD